MKVSKLALTGVIFFMCAGFALAAETRVCASGSVEVKSAVGHVSEIVMADGVADLVRSGDPSTIKVEHTAGHLFITPLSPAPAVLTIIDRRGYSHRLHYVFGNGVDEKIIVEDCRGAAGDTGNGDGAMRLMRELVRGRLPRGAIEKPVDAVVLDNETWHLRLVKALDYPPMMGYLAVIRNKSTVTAMVPLQQVMLPGLLAVSSDKDFLAQNEEGTVYMVVGGYGHQ